MRQIFYDAFIFLRIEGEKENMDIFGIWNGDVFVLVKFLLDISGLRNLKKARRYNRLAKE